MIRAQVKAILTIKNSGFRMNFLDYLMNKGDFNPRCLHGNLNFLRSKSNGDRASGSGVLTWDSFVKT